MVQDFFKFLVKKFVKKLKCMITVRYYKCRDKLWYCVRVPSTKAIWFYKMVINNIISMLFVWSNLTTHLDFVNANVLFFYWLYGKEAVKIQQGPWKLLASYGLNSQHLIPALILLGSLSGTHYCEHHPKCCDTHRPYSTLHDDRNSIH